ncbi:hypothetical protein [uncultured Winogradskyella sp.]|nr:hypothetical protein [uncultured Winogradskyella sp.]
MKDWNNYLKTQFWGGFVAGGLFVTAIWIGAYCVMLFNEMPL